MMLRCSDDRDIPMPSSRKELIVDGLDKIRELMKFLLHILFWDFGNLILRAYYQGLA